MSKQVLMWKPSITSMASRDWCYVFLSRNYLIEVWLPPFEIMLISKFFFPYSHILQNILQQFNREVARSWISSIQVTSLQIEIKRTGHSQPEKGASHLRSKLRSQEPSDYIPGSSRAGKGPPVKFSPNTKFYLVCIHTVHNSAPSRFPPKTLEHLHMISFGEKKNIFAFKMVESFENVNMTLRRLKFLLPWCSLSGRIRMY